MSIQCLRSVWVIPLLVTAILSVSCAEGQLIAGTIAHCENEGEAVQIPFNLNDPCLTCMCKYSRDDSSTLYERHHRTFNVHQLNVTYRTHQLKIQRTACEASNQMLKVGPSIKPRLDSSMNGEVICIQEKCPELPKDCTLVIKHTGVCCAFCKDCRLEGKTYNTSSTWLSSTKPCTLHSCLEGVLSKVQVRCVVPCTHPLTSAGTCCPVCKGCLVGGKEYTDGEEFFLDGNPCIKCVCSGGLLQCVREVCPLLSCPSSLHAFSGQCCPRCHGQRRVFDLRPGSCLFKSNIYTNNESFTLDSCTTCVCMDSTVVCEKRCRHGGDVCSEPDTCCEECILYVQPQRACRMQHNTYQHGKSWSPEPCVHCVCHNGSHECHRTQCPAHTVCPQGQTLRREDHECCAKCVERPGTCTVFGDPHYRTFDGKAFNFQGTCRYTLTRDCSPAERFHVLVQNEGRNTRFFSWTKAVEIHLGFSTVRLLPHLRVLVNKTKAPPFYETPSFAVNNTGNLVTVYTTFGITVTWDGNGFVEVAAEAYLRGRLCGLCGNYNGHRRDEFLSRDGSFRRDIEGFAESWRADDNEVCDDRVQPHLPDLCAGFRKKRRRARRECRKLTSWGFRRCHEVIDIIPYYKSCIMDMCECPSHKRCFCEAFLAYTRACEHEGLRIHWNMSHDCRAECK